MRFLELLKLEIVPQPKRLPRTNITQHKRGSIFFLAGDLIGAENIKLLYMRKELSFRRTPEWQFANWPLYEMSVHVSLLIAPTDRCVLLGGHGFGSPKW